MKKLKLISILFVIVIMTVSCQKEAGPAGANGTNGTNGTNGNANVIYSTWIGFNNAFWSPVLNEFSKTVRLYAAFAPNLTQGIIDSGAVLVYFKTIGTPQPQPLPITYNWPPMRYLGFRLRPDTIKIVTYHLDDNDDPGIFNGSPSTNAYRYIIIPGGVQAAVSVKKQQIPYEKLKLMQYENVCEYLNIPK